MITTAIPLATNFVTPAVTSLSTSTTAPGPAANTSLPSFVSLLSSLIGSAEKPSVAGKLISADKPARPTGHPQPSADNSSKQDPSSDQLSLATPAAPAPLTAQPVLIPIVLQSASPASPAPAAPVDNPANNNESGDADVVAANIQPAVQPTVAPESVGPQAHAITPPAPKPRTVSQPPNGSEPEPARPAPVYPSYNKNAQAAPIPANPEPAQPAPVYPSYNVNAQAAPIPANPEPAQPAPVYPSYNLNAQAAPIPANPEPVQLAPTFALNNTGSGNSGTLPQPVASNPQPAQRQPAAYVPDNSRPLPQPIVSSPAPAQAQATLYSSGGNRATASQILSVDVPVAPQSTVALDGSKPPSKPSLAFTAKITPAASATANQSAPTVQASPAPTPQWDDPSQDNGQGDPDPVPQKPVLKALSKTEPAEANQSATPASSSLTQTPSTDAAFSALPRAVFSTETPAPAPTQNVATKADPIPVNQPSDERPVAAALPDTNSSSKSEPLRDLSLHIGSSPTNQVEVKVQERAGALHVAVLSSSPNLTADLRQQVGDLVGKLDRAGYHAETFGPSASLSSKQSDSQSGTGQQQEPSGREQPQNQQQNQGGRKRTTQPQWMQEMNSFGPTAVEGVENQ